MGVWERSAEGREIASKDTCLEGEYKKILSDFSPADVIGSPYSIYNYRVDSILGGEEGLAVFRRNLVETGKFLLLDYVPNHLSLDNQLIFSKPEMFLSGTQGDLRDKPNEYFSKRGGIYAHGKDPYFPPWNDTVQINAFSSDARQVAIDTLLNIASKSDGVRCDMAMLLLNDIFKKIWDDKVGKPPKMDFWEEIIPKVKKKHPNFLFIAEVYWEMEWNLQQQGFDYCYDKRLYDRLLQGNAQSVKAHLEADWDFQRKLVRFIENHDEQRAVDAFGKRKSMAAAIIMLTLPGAHLMFDGQVNGYSKKLPIQLGRAPLQREDSELQEFYENLLDITSNDDFFGGKWRLCEIYPLNDNDNFYLSLLAYLWQFNNNNHLVVVNYGAYSSKAHIKINGLEFGNGEWIFEDVLNKKIYLYDGKNIHDFGLFVELSPWKAHIFKLYHRP